MAFLPLEVNEYYLDHARCIELKRLFDEKYPVADDSFLRYSRHFLGYKYITEMQRTLLERGQSREAMVNAFQLLPHFQALKIDSFMRYLGTAEIYQHLGEISECDLATDEGKTIAMLMSAVVEAQIPLHSFEIGFLDRGNGSWKFSKEVPSRRP